MLGGIPLQTEITKTGGPTNAQWRSWLTALYNLVLPLGGNGTTAQRPVLGLYVGLQYFDTTLGKPIFVKTVATPAVWVDATGGVV